MFWPKKQFPDLIQIYKIVLVHLKFLYSSEKNEHNFTYFPVGNIFAL